MNKPITSKEMKDWVGKTWDRCQKQAWSEAMNRDEIIRMAREAFGAPMRGAMWGMNYSVYMPDLERFAALVAAAEREACAKACEDEIKRVKPIYSVTAENALKAIRARGEK